MAEFNCQTRRKFSEKWEADMKTKGRHLSEREKKLLPTFYNYVVSQEVCDFIREPLRKGKYKTLSELYQNEFHNLVDVCVRKEWQEEFYYALDEMNCYQMTSGRFRRSLRSKSYIPFAGHSIHLLRTYAWLDFYGGNLADILTGNVSPEIYDHARNEHFDYAGILATQIDHGEGKTIQAVKDILFGENNTMMMSRELVLGIVMSKSKELYEDIGRFLLAARLQEGARQVVCETMDAGRPEAFLSLFSIIEENDLIRFSSVKRAVGTWIGIFDEYNLERITQKLLRLMGQCLRNEAFVKEQLATNDAVAISCALWAKGFYDAHDAVQAICTLAKTGTRQQKMTASYFMQSLQDENLQTRISKALIRSHPEDLELAACFMPGFMASTEICFFDLLKEDGQHNFSVLRDGVRKPKPLAVEEYFDNAEEAEEFYHILREIMKKIPAKGLVLSPCIFPWYQVSMSQSDIAVRLCLIAWMLQKESLLDEAAEMIPLIGQRKNSYFHNYYYPTASRAAAARLLLYRPASGVRKKVLFDLLHNAEEYTNQSAHLLVEDMELSKEDYIAIERNVKYKKGRAGTFALLGRQDSKNLSACITRLLAEKSEDCHMGALELAIQLKKDDEKAFAGIIPKLQDFSDPTGKEQVLLDELLSTESKAQDIINTPGYGLCDMSKDWILPLMNVDADEAAVLFSHGEEAYIHVLQKLDKLISDHAQLSYKTRDNDEQLLGNGLGWIRWIYDDPDTEPLDAYPFREMWEEFYEKEIDSPQLLMETKLYYECCRQRNNYEQAAALYQTVFGNGSPKKPLFSDLMIVLSYERQVDTVLFALFNQYVPRSLSVHFGLCGIAGLLSVLDTSNDLYTMEERGWSGSVLRTYTGRVTKMPIFSDMCKWITDADKGDWEDSFTLRFHLQLYYDGQKEREIQSQGYYRRSTENYLRLSDFVQCYVRGIWDKDLFYKAVLTFLDMGILLAPISAVEQKGAVSYRKAGIGSLNDFFGFGVIKPVDGKYRFDMIGEEIPEMTFAHELYREVLPVVLKVELTRTEQPTPFSEYMKEIKVIYGIGYMIQILTALGKDPLQRGGYYSYQTERKQVLSVLLKVSRPEPEETAEDLKKALKGTDITKKRLIELAMYAPQWIPMIEEYLKMPGLASTCYYFMAHTSEYWGERVTSTIAKYTPLSQEDLRDGAFDIHWFFEAYEKLGEKGFRLLYDAAKYSATGAAHARARKYADAALGNVEKDALKTEINAKRNKDLLMSIGLLPLPKARKAREAELLDRYQFIQNYKKESRRFGAQRRASEGRAADIALRNLSVNAGFTDVTRLMLRMEGKLTEVSTEYFDWRILDEIELMVSVDEFGKSTLLCRKDGKLLKSVPAKYKKNETVQEFQKVTKKLKEQYSRTRQMMEQAMEDKTVFEVSEFLELFKNPITRPITEPLVVTSLEEENAGEQNGEERNVKLGFFTKDGILDVFGSLHPVRPEDKIVIAHPFDLYKSGNWHEYQKLLFEKQKKQPFKQVFRELYVKLEEELEKEESLLFAGNQIQPKKTVSALRSRRWVADYEAGLQKIYYKENIVAYIYAMADWFSPSDVEAPTLEYVIFTDRETGRSLKIKDIPDVIYSEVMRDVDLAVSIAHAGGVDPETSHSTIEMRKAIVACNLSLFQKKNVRLEGNHAIIDGKLGQYTVHLGSGVVHQLGNAMLFVVPVHSQHRGRIFLPFVDDDPKTAEIMSKILLFAEDQKIKDPNILRQIR
ncbi:MAG: DUF4132 domain-containing protein [Lachnospiraceae bacterium]|nr:DUF4132 domain-containing protein [Lachnospiraceae bacterium]